MSILIKILLCSILFFNVEASFSDASFLLRQKNNFQKLISQKDHILGIEIVVAGADSLHPFSLFGHGMIRFVSDKNQFQSDLVVSFLADEDESRIKYYDGIVGKYKVFPFIDTFGKFWETYSQTENRSLTRIVIPTNKIMRNRLIDVLKKWMTSPEEMGDYTFFSNSCAKLIQKLFEEADFSVGEDIKTAIPVNLEKKLQSNWLAPYPHLEMKSFSNLRKKIMNVLKIENNREISNPDRWTQMTQKMLRESFTSFEIMQMMVNLSNVLPIDLKLDLLTQYNFIKGPYTLEEILGYQSVPLSLYELCVDLTCAKEKYQTAKSFFSEEDFLRSSKINDENFHQAFGINNELDEQEREHEVDYLQLKDGFLRDPDTALSFKLYLQVIRSNK